MSTYSRGYDAARIGVLGLLAAAAFVGLFLYMTNRGLSMRRPDLFVRFATATGLQKGDAVLYRGVQVGRVKRLMFTDEGSVLVRAELTEVLPLTTDAHAQLVAIDLFGRQSLVLQEGTRYAPRLEPSDTIAGKAPESMSSKVAELGERAERMMSDSMVMLLQQTLAGSAQAMQHVAVLSATVNRLVSAQQANVTALTGEFAAVARNLNTVTAPAELEQTRGNLTRVTARLDSATVTLASLMEGLEAGEGSAGKLLRDDKLYDRTEALLAGLEELVRDVKTNPKRYINVKVF
jgi:phospholipid/cholesterol/gamma-HCH transport system substrate-binding protein